MSEYARGKEVCMKDVIDHGHCKIGCKLKIGIVVPTYKKDLWDKFYTKWNWDCPDYSVTLYMVEDNPKKTIKAPKGRVCHYDWSDIDKDLGEDSWIISRGSSSIRSYGYLKAYQDNMDYILTLDDDCYPDDRNKTITELIDSHLVGLDKPKEYSNTFHVGAALFANNDLWMRGSPIRYRKPRRPVISIGGWNHNPDLDAWTQLENQTPHLSCMPTVVNVPKYSGITMCGMNVMFERSVIPIAYFLLQGERWGVDRVDDIWAGLFMKKVLDYFDLPMCINGAASIFHDRASDALVSLKKEGLTLQETELLWDRLSTLDLVGDSLTKAYRDIVFMSKSEWFGKREYGSKLKEAMITWVNLFE